MALHSIETNADIRLQTAVTSLVQVVDGFRRDAQNVGL